MCAYCFQVARGGQSVTLVGSKLVMFGGEDRNRRLLNDVRILDLETMTWSSVETTYVSECLLVAVIMLVEEFPFTLHLS